MLEFWEDVPSDITDWIKCIYYLQCNGLSLVLLMVLMCHNCPLDLGIFYTTMMSAWVIFQMLAECCVRCF